MSSTATEIPELIQSAVDSLPLNLAILDECGEIRWTNSAWREFATQNDVGMATDMVGVNYLDVTANAETTYSREAEAYLDALLSGEIKEFEHEYPCHGPNEFRWFLMRAVAFTANERRYAAVAHVNITERKLRERELKTFQESLDRLLQRIEGLVEDIMEALVRANSREEIEALTAERFASGNEYGAVWLGRYDEVDDRLTVVQASGDQVNAHEPIDLGENTNAVQALRDAIENQTARVVEKNSGLPDVSRADERAVVVPLSYRSTTYGVLVVSIDENDLVDRERRLLQQLGCYIGAVINGVLTKQTMATDTVLNVAAGIHDEGLSLIDLSAELDCVFKHRATTVDGGDMLTLARTDYQDAEKLVETAERYDDVVAAKTIVADDRGCVVQFQLTDSPLCSVLVETGAREMSMDAHRTSLDIEFQVGTERMARQAITALRETYERVELLAFHEVDDPVQTDRGFREKLRARLTERQLTALRRAYVSGFFEWPRRADGEQLADSMGIVPSTYHQHLQAAKRKLVDEFFEE
ncbi:Signal transduction regulator [Halanaeroarchaeum sp. HSR-CO]|uniref:bacterio-opsin activator domain-containing protein n=1 Tax=Halanaeroarchaeum sp. HSR-CO TaxID=2866382 RepID=UPI00217E23F0|nr:bacterio-opsin activator domain-containing protein [Halanaeroarchaeum sp. HSR-CO]UWG47646.1 Signal transduction regulator [Halanaeroarchaeum sp. HSR-CO]